MLNKTGVITIAIKHPYYGKMAHNLCGTFKAENPDVPFYVIADDVALSHLVSWQKDIFDKIIPYDGDVSNPFASKFEIYRLSPFETTVFFDADTAWLPGTKFSDLISSIPEDVEYTGITEGFFSKQKNELHEGYPSWANPDHMIDSFALKYFYQWRSEFIYFKKTENVAKVFKLMRTKRFTEKIKQLAGLIDFAGTIADEIYFNIALSMHDLCPHKYRWTPLFWSKLHKNKVLPIEHMKAMNYFLLSCGSNYVSGGEKRLYNAICNNSFKKIGRKHSFELASKSEIIIERKKY